MLGVVFSITAFLVSRHIENRRIENEFALLSERNWTRIRTGIDAFADIQRLLRLYFEHSEFVSRKEFHDLGTNLLNDTPAIQAIQWVALVRDAERAAFERRCVEEGLTGFRIKNHTANGRFETAAPADQYWVITYCEPVAGNDSVLGYNLLTAPTAPVLKAAAETGKSLGTPTFPLAQTDNVLGWILLGPVFGEQAGATNPSRELLGFVQVVFRVETMLSEVIGDDPEDATQWIIQDVSPGAGNRTLYYHFQNPPKADEAVETLLPSSRLMAEHSFTFRDRIWKMTVSPSPAWLSRQRTLFPHAILVLGLCLTGALQLHVQGLNRRNDLIEREVTEKTARLSESNRQVLAEAAERRKIQDHLELVLRGADLGTWESNLATGSLTFSPRLATMLDFDPSEPEPTRAWWQERIHPEDLKDSLQAVKDHLEGHTSQIEIVQRIRKRDGSYIWAIDLSSIVERDDAGNPLRVAGTRADIHDRTLAELRALRLATAVEQATESIVLLDMQGRVEFANRAFTGRMDTTESALLGREFDTVWPSNPEDASMKFASIAAEIGRSGVWRGTLHDLHRAGQPSAEHLIVSAVTDSREQPLGYVVVARDITRETALEEQVRQSQKMEAVGLLAGGVAHDFNNLLQIIRGYAALAAESDSLAEQKGHLGLVLDAVDRASQLTRQLLAFGRRQALQRTVIDLNAMTEEMLRMIRRIIPENIEITPYIAPEPLCIRGDRGQIEQVLLNLCVNARDAMPDGGRLIIHLDSRDVDKAASARHDGINPGRYARLRVVDSGSGMDPATLARIFEPFFSTKPKDRGTGLGLSVVYGIIRQHDGFVDVTSHPGKGTSFSILFPLALEDECDEEPETTRLAPASIQPGDGTVLLVEDEQPVRALAVRVLKRAGYKVITADNGAEACEIFAENPDAIDIVVMDMVMPKMGGREAYHRINVLKPGVPVLFCSGYSSEGQNGTFDLPPGTSLLAKPYLPSEFSALIARMIQDARARSASV
jgi:PAS domain S-box-containing protein